MNNIEFFEANFSYFFGFGFPFALVTSYFPSLLSMGVWAVLFPFFVLSSISAAPPNFDKIKSIQEYLKLKGSITWKDKPVVKKNKYKRVGIFVFAKLGVSFVAKYLSKRVM